MGQQQSANEKQRAATAEGASGSSSSDGNSDSGSGGSGSNGSRSRTGSRRRLSFQEAARRAAHQHRRRSCSSGRPGEPSLASHAVKSGAPDGAPTADLTLWSHRVCAVSGGDAATAALASVEDPTTAGSSARNNAPSQSAPHLSVTSLSASEAQAASFPPPRHLSAPPAAACPLAALPADLLLHCLIRLPRADWPRLRAVCRTWRRLVACPDFLRLRRADGRGESWLFAVEWMFKGGCSGDGGGTRSCSRQAPGSGAGVWGGGGRRGGGSRARGVGGISVDLGDGGSRDWGAGGIGEGAFAGREQPEDEEAGEARRGDEEGVRRAGSSMEGDWHGSSQAAEGEVPPATTNVRGWGRGHVLLQQQLNRSAVSNSQRARSASLSPATATPTSASSPSLALLWAYDPVKQQWYSHGCLPPMRGIGHSSSLLALGPCLILLGGSCSGACCAPGGGACGPSRAVWRYNVVTGKARRLADMAWPRFNCAAAVLPSSGRIIVAGGTGPVTTTAAAGAADGASAAHPGPTVGGSSSSGSRAEWVGVDEALQAAELYDPTTNRWLPLPPLHHPTRCSQGLVLADGSFWVVSTSSLYATRSLSAEVLDAPALAAAVATALGGAEGGRRASKEGWGGRRASYGAGDTREARASVENERETHLSAGTPYPAWRVVPCMLPRSLGGLVSTRLTTADGCLLLTNHVAPMCHQVFEYLPHSNSWRDAGKLPVCGFRGFGVVGLNGQLLVEGGVEAAGIGAGVGFDPGRFLQRTPYVNAFQPRTWGVNEGGEAGHGGGREGGDCAARSQAHGRRHEVRQGGAGEVQGGMDGRSDLEVGFAGRGVAENGPGRQSSSDWMEGDVGGAGGHAWRNDAGGAAVQQGQAGRGENGHSNIQAPSSSVAHDQEHGLGPASGHRGHTGMRGSKILLQEAIWRPVRPFGNVGVPRVCQWCIVSTL
ncbi:hypothetical protein CLOM_g1986 [Closterium sp. NIES-68]|nr:hypothetical protein CLOM_g1986 [Closterium sp. NIES-68]GJP84532.1 hypothetical protein CLOP_g14593 [Closterium sp. NIES-67]